MSANKNQNTEACATQCFRIALHLKAGNRITGLQALDKFGCIHLPRRIKDLKDKHNMNIHDEWIEVEAFGGQIKRVKEYYLLETILSTN